MHFLSVRKYTYTVDKPIDIVRKDLLSVTDRTKKHFGENMTGTLDNDHFTFIHEAVLGYFKNDSGKNFVVLKGTLTANDQSTIIETRLQPRVSPLLLFCIIAGFLLSTVIAIATYGFTTDTWFLLSLAFVACLLLGLTVYMTNSLKNMFERALGLKGRQYNS